MVRLGNAMSIPRVGCITATRTALREVSAADLDDLIEINGDPEVTRFLPYETWSSASDASAWLQRMTGLAASGSARQLVIVRRTDSKVIGTVLVFKYEEGSQRIELGYVLGRRHWRQGYAAEALRALIGHVFGEWGIRRIEAEVNPLNLASNALLRSLGFTHEGTLRERWFAKGQVYSVNAYGLLATEWAGNAA